MDCPYLDCQLKTIAPDLQACPQCGHFLKRCACRAPNRSFARFCRACGQPLDQTDGWSTRRGGGRSLGLVPEVLKDFGMQATSVLRFSVAGACRGLLLRDGWLFAVSREGELAWANLCGGEGRVKRTNLGRNVAVHPALDGDTLYLGMEGEIRACSLAGLPASDGEFQPLRELRVDGHPVGALTAAFGCLYFHLRKPDGRRELWLYPDFAGANPPAGVCLDSGAGAGSVAVEPAGRAAWFAAPDGPAWRLQGIAHAPDGSWEALPGFVPGGLEEVATGSVAAPSAAIIGMRLYLLPGGDKAVLRRVNLESRFVDQTIPDVSDFAASTPNEIATIRCDGVHFTHLGVGVDWSPGDQPALQCPPVLWRRTCLAVGLESGNVVLFRWDNPNEQKEIVVAGGGGLMGASALAGWRNFLAVGNQSGHVEVFVIR